MVDHQTRKALISLAEAIISLEDQITLVKGPIGGAGNGDLDYGQQVRSAFEKFHKAIGEFIKVMNDG